MQSGNFKMTRITAWIFILVITGVRAVDIQEGDAKELQQALSLVDVEMNDELRRQMVLQRLEKLFGIRSDIEEKNLKEIPPQFMMELYNTVTDEDGRKREKNPYNAKIVRSFVETDSSSAHFYNFNIPELEQNELILAAELHLYRKRSSTNSIHPSVLSSPYYLIKVYQVLPDKSLEEPDLHRLLNVHYVGAYASGWQIFNVKEAVISWLSDTPNLGLLVTATTIFGDHVTVDFYRRDDQPHDKQPILVLFNDDNLESGNLKVHISESNNEQVVEEEEDKVEADEVDLEERAKRESQKIRNKRHDIPENTKDGQLEEVPEYIEENLPVIFMREKKQRNDNRAHRLQKAQGFVPRRKSLEKTLTSMDIYQRAMLREKLNSNKNAKVGPETPQKESAWLREESSRTKRETVEKTEQCRKVDKDPCARREMHVNFEEIGLSTIIAPPSYSAYQCRGHCKSPLSLEQKPTNHATIQGIIHKMNLAPSQDVEMPCCVPVNLSSISILYLENETEVVLKDYTDMVVVNCGCR